MPRMELIIIPSDQEDQLKQQRRITTSASALDLITWVVVVGIFLLFLLRTWVRSISNRGKKGGK